MTAKNQLIQIKSQQESSMPDRHEYHSAQAGWDLFQVLNRVVAPRWLLSEDYNCNDKVPSFRIDLIKIKAVWLLSIEVMHGNASGWIIGILSMDPLTIYYLITLELQPYLAVAAAWVESAQQYSQGGESCLQAYTDDWSDSKTLPDNGVDACR